MVWLKRSRFGRQPLFLRNRWRGWAVFAGLPLLLAALPAGAATIVRGELADGVTACAKGGRVLYLECALPRDASLEPFLAPYLADPKLWTQYKGRQQVAIPFEKLCVPAQRQTLEAVFSKDYVDEKGWWHTVAFGGADGVENWWTLCEWLTGLGTNQHAVMNHRVNRKAGQELGIGEKVLIPLEYLKPGFQSPSPPERRPQESEQEDQPSGKEKGDAPEAPSGGFTLEYRKDSQGAYAVYRIRKGEALYSSVVARFTDYRENADIIEACEIIQRRSGIVDARKMEAGDPVKIPLEMLSDRYQPEGSEGRSEYEAVRKEAERLEAEHVHSKDLRGVVVVLDPGHGGRDHGAAIEKKGLYEDELNYDILCRLKKILEAKSSAKICVTLEDPDQGYKESKVSRFTHDTDEKLLTTPPYPNQDGEISANLRWAMANALLAKEKAAGTDERNVMFISIHCDSLDPRLRGTMIYVPGARYRVGNGRSKSAIYEQFKESRGVKNISTTARERRRDEALSTTFANLVVKKLNASTPPIKVHDTGQPVLNVIRRSRNNSFVPAVLRYNRIPVKILVETGNLSNTSDQRRFADAEWRQAYAEALFEAIRAYYAS